MHMCEGGCTCKDDPYGGPDQIDDSDFWCAVGGNWINDIPTTHLGMLLAQAGLWQEHAKRANMSVTEYRETF